VSFQLCFLGRLPSCQKQIFFKPTIQNYLPTVPLHHISSDRLEESKTINDSEKNKKKSTGHTHTGHTDRENIPDTGTKLSL